MTLRGIVRQLNLGKLAYHLFYSPLGRIRSSLRNGGPWAERETERARQEMEQAATHLGTLPQFAGATPITLHLMTGRRFWYQTAFCLHTFARMAGVTTCAELYDDGTIDDACAQQLRRLGPTINIRFAADLRRRCETLLPLETFPSLRERYVHYPNIRKLIDVHLGSNGWKLVIDSDLLFFRRPAALLDWLAAPDSLLHAIDCEESYGYSRPLLEQLAGKALPDRLNVGICGLKSDALDWRQLEAWTTELQRRERTHYYLEQALVALLATQQRCTAVPPDKYVTLPKRAEVIAPTAVMHHYVDTSKRWYFRFGWHNALRDLSASPVYGR